MSDLFRQDAIDHQRDRFCGEILLTRSRLQVFWTTVVCVLVGLLFAFISIVGFARQEIVIGILVPGVDAQRLTAPPTGGVISNVHVALGQLISAGTALFTIDTTANSQAVTSVAEPTPSTQEGQTLNILRADRPGRLIGVMVEQRDTVKPGQLLGIVAPQDGELEVELYVPPRLLGFMSVGSTVLIRYDALPYQQFGQHLARVHHVSAMPIAATALNLHQEAHEANALYRVRALFSSSQVVHSEGHPIYLPPGSTVTAVLRLDRHTVLEWILESLMLTIGTAR